jgi:hypothetical protein
MDRDANATLLRRQRSGKPAAKLLRRPAVKRLLVIAVALGCMGVYGRAAAQNSGSGQQAKPDTAQPSAPSQNAAPTQEPAATASTGIIGKWHFVLETPGGDRESDADLAVDQDGKVTGKFGNSDVAGTYKEGKLDLDFPFTSDELGETAELKFSGKLDDTNALTGTWEFVSYNGTFKATRLKV